MYTSTEVRTAATARAFLCSMIVSVWATAAVGGQAPLRELPPRCTHQAGITRLRLE
jgi:hypothetical protein